MKRFSDNISVFRNLMVNTMRFQEFTRHNDEICWQQSVPRTPYSIQVRSGMRADNTHTPAPDIGIRLYLVDTITLDSVVPLIRVRRTEHSLRNVREKIGFLFKLALNLAYGKSTR